ncbi:unnamed protein product [Symbiodinium sp. CCMP2592]|nr:unnamed protein product [Symbiodinium sp. CCMP2592]
MGHEKHEVGGCLELLPRRDQVDPESELEAPRALQKYKRRREVPPSLPTPACSGLETSFPAPGTAEAIPLPPLVDGRAQKKNSAPSVPESPTSTSACQDVSSPAAQAPPVRSAKEKYVLRTLGVSSMSKEELKQQRQAVCDRAAYLMENLNPSEVIVKMCKGKIPRNYESFMEVAAYVALSGKLEAKKRAEAYLAAVEDYLPLSSRDCGVRTVYGDSPHECKCTECRRGKIRMCVAFQMVIDEVGARLRKKARTMQSKGNSGDASRRAAIEHMLSVLEQYLVQNPHHLPDQIKDRSLDHRRLPPKSRSPVVESLLQQPSAASPRRAHQLVKSEEQQSNLSATPLEPAAQDVIDITGGDELGHPGEEAARSPPEPGMKLESQDSPTASLCSAAPVDSSSQKSIQADGAKTPTRHQPSSSVSRNCWHCAEPAAPREINVPDDRSRAEPSPRRCWSPSRLARLRPCGVEPADLSATDLKPLVYRGHVPRAVAQGDRKEKKVLRLSANPSRCPPAEKEAFRHSLSQHPRRSSLRASAGLVQANPDVRHRPSAALRIKKQWCDKIFDSTKTWEIRGSALHKRGRVCIAQSKSSQLVGEVTFVDCLQVGRFEDGKLVPWSDSEDDRQNFIGRTENFTKHCIEDLGIVQYPRVFAWVMEQRQRYEKPVLYKHKMGCVNWVKLDWQHGQGAVKAPLAPGVHSGGRSGATQQLLCDRMAASRCRWVAVHRNRCSSVPHG